MKTIIAAFCDQASAQQALDYLQSRNINDAQLMSYSDGTTMTGQFDTYGIPDDRAQLYAEVMRRGAPIVVAHCDHDAREIARDLDRMGSLDLDAAAKRWRKEGWNGYDASSLPYDAQQCASERTALRSESMLDDTRDTTLRDTATARGDTAPGRDLDVVEEQVHIGKREVQRGGVRVRTFVTERPVHEQVQLREERIDVAREPVNQAIPAGAADSTFTEDEFELTARGEEAVVGKEARIVERVHVGKVAETRTEDIQETERRRDVKVEQLDADRRDPLHKR